MKPMRNELLSPPQTLTLPVLSFPTYLLLHHPSTTHPFSTLQSGAVRQAALLPTPPSACVSSGRASPWTRAAATGVGVRDLNLSPLTKHHQWAARLLD